MRSSKRRSMACSSVSRLSGRCGERPRAPARSSSTASRCAERADGFAPRPGGGTRTALSHSSPREGMVREPLDLLGRAGPDRASRWPRRSAREARAPVVEQAAVGDLVGQRVLEGVLELGEQARLVQELGGLEAGEPAAQLLLAAARRSPGAARTGTSLPMTAAVWSRRFSSGGSRSMRAARIACTVAGTWIVCDGLRQPVGAALARSAPSSRPGSGRSPPGRTDSPRSLDRSRLSGCERRIVAEERLEQLPGALGRQRVEPKLACSRSCCPSGAGTRGGSSRGGAAARPAGSRPGCRAAPGSRCRSSGGPRRPRGAAAPGSPAGAAA